FSALGLLRRTSKQFSTGRIEFIGAGLATAAFTCVIFALSVAGEGAPGGLLAVVGSLAVALFVLLVLQQRRTSHRLVPSDLARDRLIVLGNIATALTGACFQVGLWYFLTYRMQTQFGYSPIQAGLAFFPLTASMLVVNLWFTPRLMKRRAPRALIVAGVVVAVPGLLWLTVVDGASFTVAVLVPTV